MERSILICRSFLIDLSFSESGTITHVVTVYLCMFALACMGVRALHEGFITYLFHNHLLLVERIGNSTPVLLNWLSLAGLAPE